MSVPVKLCLIVIKKLVQEFHKNFLNILMKYLEVHWKLHRKLLDQQHPAANSQIIVEVLKVEADQDADDYDRDPKQPVLLHQKELGIEVIYQERREN